MDGYYTQHSAKNEKNSLKTKSKEPAILSSSSNVTSHVSVVASNGAEITLPESTHIVLNLQTPDTSECDIIQLKNNQEIGCIVTEIGTTEIRYKKCDNPNGPTIVISKSDVFLITYKNGSVDMINSKSDTQPKNTVNNQNSNQTPYQPLVSTERKQHPFINKSLLLLIGGFLSCLLYFISPFLLTLGIIAFLVSIVLSAIALVKIKRDPKKFSGKKKAIIFLILGILGIILGPLLAGLILLAMV
jgi:hypothetical protein